MVRNARERERINGPTEMTESLIIFVEFMTRVNGVLVFLYRFFALNVAFSPVAIQNLANPTG